MQVLLSNGRQIVKRGFKYYCGAVAKSICMVYFLFMPRSEYIIEEYRSAHSAKVRKIVFAPPFLVFLLFVLNILIEIPVSYIISKISLAVGIMISHVGVMLLLVLFVVKTFGLSGSEVVPFKKIEAIPLLLVVIAMLFASVLSDYLVYLTEYILPQSLPISERDNKLIEFHNVLGFVYKFIFVCVVPSFCEEVFYRGFCQTSLVNSWKRGWGIFLTAFLFSIAHLNPYYIHVYLILGLFLGFVSAFGGSIWYPIAAHFVNNLWVFVFYALGVSVVGNRFDYTDILFIAISLLGFLSAIWFLYVFFRRRGFGFKMGSDKNPLL